MSKSRKYWRERFEELEKIGYRQGSELIEQIERVYGSSRKELTKEMLLWYQRIAKNNGVSMQQARQLLDKEELDEFRWTVEEYIARGEENAVNEEWLEELENASAKAHITRLEAMQMSARNIVETMTGKSIKYITDGLGAVFAEGVYRAGYELERGRGTVGAFGRVNEDWLRAALKKPWTNDSKTFADRLGRDKRKLVKAVDDTITKGILKGSAVNEMTAELTKATGESRKSAERIIRTETAAIAEMAHQEAYARLDVEKVEISATLDLVTCPECGRLDGKVVDLKSARVGDNIQPFHPNCRCCTVPYFDDDYFHDTERAARDPQTGKSVYVEDMSYEEWKEKYVEGVKDVANSGESGIIKYIELPTEINKIAGMSEDVSLEISRAIDYYKESYNINIDNVKVTSFGKGNENSPFRYQPTKKGNWYSANLEINKDYNFNGSIEEYQNRIMRNYNKGALAAKSIEDLIGHEMAHFMTFGDSKTWEDFTELESEISGKFIKGISLYADSTYDGAESIAEAFIRIKNGESVPDEARSLVERYVERWRK